MLHLNWIDYVVIAIFSLSVIAGLTRGLFKEVISLITLVAAFVIATLFAHPVAVSFMQTESVQSAVNQASSAAAASDQITYAAIGLSFGVLFAGTVLIGAIIGAILNMIFKAGILGIGNRLFGGAFGFCRGFLICLALIFLVQLTSFASDDTWQQSQAVNLFKPAVEWLGNAVSPALANLKEKLGVKVESDT